jgi:hypothetical protein
MITMEKLQILQVQKRILFWVVIGFLVISAVFVAVSINQKLNTAATINTISFSGEGKVLAKPDVAVVDFSIVTEVATSKAAQDANSARSQKAVDFLKKQKVDEKDIKTISYNISPKYSYPRNEAPRIEGYRVDQTVRVKIRDLGNVSPILDGIVAAGVNQVNNLSFEIDEPEKLKAEARAEAIADAKKKAGELKDQIGVKLGRIVNFSEGVSGYPMPVYGAMALEKAGGGGGPSVPSGENEITVNVTITYQIK